jgi:hypothetical protein
MDEAHNKEFTIAMQTLAVAFEKEATEDLYEVYWQALKDLPLDAVLYAAREALKTSEWMPKPASLRRLAGEVGPDHRAAIAWQAVRKAINQHGTYCSVDFSDPVINATIRNLGGWTELGMKDEKDFDVWTRKEFERIYVAIYSTGVTEEASAHLVGRTEHENRDRYEFAPPVKIEIGLPPPNVRKLTSGGAPKEIAQQIVAKAFKLAEGK